MSTIDCPEEVHWSPETRKKPTWYPHRKSVRDWSWGARNKQLARVCGLTARPPQPLAGGRGRGLGRDSIPGRLAPAGHRRLSGQPISAGFTTAVIDEPRLAARDPRSHWLPAGHASWAGIRPPVNQSLYPATVGKPAALHLTLAPPTGRVLVNRSPPICLLLSLSLPPCA